MKTDSKVTIEKVEAKLGHKLEKLEKGAVKRWIISPPSRFRPMPGVGRELFEALLEIEQEE